ncbi:hypothetical protein Y032_0072g632 [Ancylostoma ceylanicum]|nr:hypothetical protein Y032_0072g632 [Ancylostoma ceylanicum]
MDTIFVFSTSTNPYMQCFSHNFLLKILDSAFESGYLVPILGVFITWSAALDARHSSLSFTLLTISCTVLIVCVTLSEFISITCVNNIP